MIIERKRAQKVVIFVIVLVIVVASLVFVIRQTKSMKAKRDEQKLLIILIDGMRYDYPERDTQLKAFQRLAREGVKAEYLEPIYPANSYPNWYTILTGLYAENHAMIDNYIYEPQLNDFFLMSPHPNTSHKHWWNKAEPIWTLAELSGLPTSVYYWDGCQIELNGVIPTRCLPYRPLDCWPGVDEETEASLDQILDGFSSDKFRLSLLYYEPVDHMGHSYGPDSNETLHSVRVIDGILLRLLENINKRKLSDILNVYIVSDHGMATPTTLIRLEDHIDFNDVELSLQQGSLCMMKAVNADAEQRIYEKLNSSGTDIGLRIYRKNEIPDEMHIKHNRLTLPLLLVARPGYYMLPPSIRGKVYPVYDRLYFHLGKGTYGYFAKEFDQMRGITYAIGP
ncbi:ectonucleotide pyrophosphatase/phosphodiesterase family member 6-like isoform X1, partial [Dinothrombium tinctorium]